jgi:two-component system, OmpR family, sensor kinase
MTHKWRPSLLLVLGGAIGAVLTLPIIGLFALRALSPVLGFRHSALLIAAGVLIAAAILGLLLWRLLLNPITALADHAARITTGAPDAPLAHYGTQELRALGQSVQTMARTLQSREATIRSFTDHVTHELKSPLTAIRGAAEMLEAGPDARLLTTITSATAQMEAHLTALRRMAAARDPLPKGTVNIPELLPYLQGHGVQVVARGDTPLPLAREGMLAVLTQLITNAAAHGATLVTLATAGQTLTVTDNGTGISPGNQSRLFTPFFTTRRETGGTGLGLPIAQAILQANGASIAHVPTDAGTTFRIAFGEV